MDENTEHKIRDLKLRILRTEKEIAATLHNAGLSAYLRAGHPTQVNKAAERDRKRLDEKLADLKFKLEELAPGSTQSPEAIPTAEVEAAAPEKESPAPAKKVAAAKTTATSKSAPKKTTKK
jgi:hypothetical protein